MNLRPESNDRMTELAARVVAAYVGSHFINMAHLPGLITNVHGALLLASQSLMVEEVRAPVPAVPKDRSVEHNHIVCLECGLKFKSLRRHLATGHDTTAEEYRKKWDLSTGYPMAAPAFAQTRARLAKEKDFGRSHRKR